MIDLVGKRYLFILISLLIIVPGFIVFAVSGFQLKTGIDFTGGLRWEVKPVSASADNTEKFKTALAGIGYGDAAVKGGTLTSGSVETKIIIMDLPRIAGLDDQAQQDEKSKIVKQLVKENLVAGKQVTITRTLRPTANLTPLATITGTQTITASGGVSTTRTVTTTGGVTSTASITATGTTTSTTGGLGTAETRETKVVWQLDPAYEISIESVGPTLGHELLGRAVAAIALASFVILLYLTFVFRRVPNAFRYGVCAIIALLHDVLVVIGVFAILGLLFGTEIDALFVTAMLTVIGFSVHDTIVVFDRVRENIMKRRFDKFEETVNYSLVQTLVRSINTSVTVLLTLFALYMFGGASIRTFVLALLIGITSGTYSSIFNASMLLVIWENREWRRFFGGRGTTPGRPRGAVAR